MPCELDAIAHFLLAPPVSDGLKNRDLLRLALVNRFYRKKTREALDVRLMYRRRILWLMEGTGYGELFRKEENRAAWTMTAPMGYMTYCKTTAFGGERMIKFTQESWQNLLVEVDDRRDFLSFSKRSFHLRMRLWIKLVRRDEGPHEDVIVQKQYVTICDSQGESKEMIVPNGFDQDDHCTYRTRNMSSARVVMDEINHERQTKWVKFALKYL